MGQWRIHKNWLFSLPGEWLNSAAVHMQATEWAQSLLWQRTEYEQIGRCSPLKQRLYMCFGASALTWTTCPASGCSLNLQPRMRSKVRSADPWEIKVCCCETDLGGVFAAKATWYRDCGFCKFPETSHEASDKQSCLWHVISTVLPWVGHTLRPELSFRAEFWLLESSLSCWTFVGRQFHVKNLGFEVRLNCNFLMR